MVTLPLFLISLFVFYNFCAIFTICSISKFLCAKVSYTLPKRLYPQEIVRNFVFYKHFLYIFPVLLFKLDHFISPVDFIHGMHPSNFIIIMLLYKTLKISKVAVILVGVEHYLLLNILDLIFNICSNISVIMLFNDLIISQFVASMTLFLLCTQFNFCYEFIHVFVTCFILIKRIRDIMLEFLLF